MDMLSKIYQLVYKFTNFIWGLKTDQIALISIIISFVIYILSKRSEIKLKKYEAKKEAYGKFIDYMVKFFQIPRRLIRVLQNS